MIKVTSSLPWCVRTGSTLVLFLSQWEHRTGNGWMEFFVTVFSSFSLMLWTHFSFLLFPVCSLTLPPVLSGFPSFYYFFLPLFLFCWTNLSPFYMNLFSFLSNVISNVLRLKCVFSTNECWWNTSRTSVL